MTQPFKSPELSAGTQWWLGISDQDIPKEVILTLRLDVPPRHFADALDAFEPIGSRTQQALGPNEYEVYRGRRGEAEIGVVYHGSGALSIATAIEELARIGVRTILRMGNSGGLQDDVQVGDLIISNGAIRAERLLLDYVPAEYPAFADRALVSCLVHAAEQLEVRYHEGLTLSVASLFPGSGFETAVGVLDEDVLRRVHLWRKVGSLNIDGETSTVLTLGRLFRIRGGSLLGIGNHLVTGGGDYLRVQRQLVATGVRALELLAGELTSVRRDL